MKNPQIILNQIRELLSNLEKNLDINSLSKSKVSYRKPRGLTGEIFNLVQEGFFDKPQSISEIQKKLRLEGIKRPTSALMRPLLQLISKKFLKRDEIDNKYKYQRR